MDLREISPELVLVDADLASLARLHLPEPGSFWASPLPSTQAGAVSIAPAMEQLELSKTQRRSRQPLLLLAAASVALNGILIAHAGSSVPRPSLVLDVPRSKAEIGTGLQAEHERGVGTTRDTRTTACDLMRSRASVGPTLCDRRARPVAVRAAEPGKASSEKRLPARQILNRKSSRALDQERRSAAHSLRHQLTSQVLRSKEPTGRAASPAGIAAGGAARAVRWKAVSGADYYNVILWRDGQRVLDLWPDSPQAILPSAWSYHGTGEHLGAGRYLWFVYPGFGTRGSRQYGTLVGSGVFVVAKYQGGK